MDFSKLTTSDKVIAGSGIALLIFSFLPWFTYGGVTGRNGWDFFVTGLIPVLLGLVLVAYVAITRFSESTKLPDLPVPYGLAVLVVAGLAALLILLRLIIGYKVGAFGFSVHLHRGYGLYLSFLATLGLVAGGFMKYQEEGGKASTGPSTGTGPQTPF
jgi:hypothetical protein